MLKMRLQRIGRKNDPSYRVIVTDSRTGPKSNKYVDHIGNYNSKMNSFTIDGERVKNWISKGVQVSDTVHNLLVSNKIIEGKKINVLSRKSPIVDEAKLKAEAEAKAAAEEAATIPKEEPVAEAASETPAEEVEVEETKEETPAEVEKTPATEEVVEGTIETK
ncbi:MAG: 30S ribosomal protein S16 [Candidatus Paceibacterota bacterium]